MRKEARTLPKFLPSTFLSRIFHYSPVLRQSSSARCSSSDLEFRVQLIKRRLVHMDALDMKSWAEVVGGKSAALSGACPSHKTPGTSPRVEGDCCGTTVCVLDPLKGTSNEECASTWETVSRAQTASVLSVTHGSSSIPDGPFGASGRTKGRRGALGPPRGSPAALIGQQQTLLFWFFRLNDASQPRRLRAVTLSLGNPVIARFVFSNLHKSAALLFKKKNNNS